MLFFLMCMVFVGLEIHDHTAFLLQEQIEQCYRQWFYEKINSWVTQAAAEKENRTRFQALFTHGEM